MSELSVGEYCVVLAALSSGLINGPSRGGAFPPAPARLLPQSSGNLPFPHLSIKSKPKIQSERGRTLARFSRRLERLRDRHHRCERQISSAHSEKASLFLFFRYFQYLKVHMSANAKSKKLITLQTFKQLSSVTYGSS